MKLKTTSLEFELTPCYSCENGIATRRTLCPLNWQPVNKYPNKRCPHCQAKSKHNHQTIGEYTIVCESCDGKGLIMEDKFSSLPAEIYNSIPVTVIIGGGHRFYGEKLLGIGLVGGATDYGSLFDKVRNMEVSDRNNYVINMIRGDYSRHAMRQALNFIKDGIFCDHLEVIIRENDYSVYPFWV